MKRLLQRLDNGETLLGEVPVPRAAGISVLIETRATVVSAGTERMLVEFGRSSLVEKARRQPDKVMQVLHKVRTDGLVPTLEAVRAKLETPIPLGYCNAGVVVEVPSGITDFAIGDRVVSNGSHAEYVAVPRTLVARVPDGVSFESAAFTPLAAIGLQGIRLAEPTIGETVVVIGLGPIGLLTVQMLRANGCRVIGVDHDLARLSLAEAAGALPVNGMLSDPVQEVLAATAGVGADAVLLTLASSSDEPIRQAAAMSRKRGRLVLVGVTGLHLSRDDFYRKELTFAVSCSYGPGRYDPSYEEHGRDYPLPFVRWTEQRNFAAVLDLMADGRVDPLPLITHRFAFDDAARAYDLIASSQPSLGVVLEYPNRTGAAPERAAHVLASRRAASARSAGSVGVIGAGNFAVRTLLPILKRSGARLHTIASIDGTSAALASRKFGFEFATTDIESLIADPAIDTVFVLTRHDSHAALAIRLLEAEKHVFVEKPVALTETELDAVETAAAHSTGLLIVGFNRRFAPLTDKFRELLRGRSGPVAAVMTVNAGSIPQEHWTQNADMGGGRIVGEACHWIDLARHLVGAPILNLRVIAARDRRGVLIDDIAHISMTFADGSTAVVHYLANGARSFPKERLECFFDDRVIVIDNWRRLRRFGVDAPLYTLSRRMDKGHAAEIAMFLDAVRKGGPPPISLTEIIEVSRWSIRAAEQARGHVVREDT